MGRTALATSIIGRRLARTVALIALVTAALGFAVVRANQTPGPVPTVRLYSDDPGHLWNRLHAALFVRVGHDGRTYGADRVDPLLWADSTYLLRGSAHTQAVALLNEFVAAHAERLVTDRLKRAVLQRDLWTFFDWLQGDHLSRREPELSLEAARRSVGELSQPIATVMARLALTPEEIRALPDSYAASIASNQLPADLFQDGGPWIAVGRPEGPVAPIHLGDAGPGRNSVFVVLIRLPGGRDATLAYLDALRSFHGPLWIHDPQLPGRMQDVPNPSLPQFPTGTRVALVRRALLVDSDGRIAPSPIVEQVQLRLYREIRPMSSQEFVDGMRIDESMFARAGQDFDEFSLSRGALFANRAGGLLPLEALEPLFLTFSSHGVDPFEEGGGSTGMDAMAARRLCKDCHALPGVYSFNSHLAFRLAGPGAARGARLAAISIREAERSAVAWKQQQMDWIRLQPMLHP